jgi:hypothetical protein
MAADGPRAFALHEREREDGSKYFVGNWDGVSVLIRPDRFHKPKPGEGPKWIATLQPSARKGGRVNG